MATLTETSHAGEFIVSEANGSRSRDAGTLASGNNLVAGAVVGVVTADGKYAEHDPGASDGTETAAGILHDAVDAGAADMACVVVARDAEVNGSEITWISGISAPNQTAGIAALLSAGIKVL